ncbi:MAG: 6-carboxytetrahydropterin synthase [Phycisphaerales bacterium]|nr:6-carboxytetrahydropterin synthase [Phycisphaerales bacterium]MCB9836487.1 6-carboxytetrahydropterin synthase [Phycisphaera sp.]
MVVLRRTVRANLGGGHPDELPTGPNGHAGQPAMRGLGTYYEFEVCCAGEPDPATGYLVNIKHIDQAVRTNVLPRVHHQLTSDTSREPSELLPELAISLADALEVRLTALRWNLSPTFSLEYRMNDTKTVLMRQRFEFAAAHRLNVPAMSPDENREVFGKCNNPSGHGHNYELEVCVEKPLSEHAMHAAELEAIVDETIIQRFDHKHLNLDTTEFATATGLNPSVENIARVCYDLLAPAIATGSGNPALASVTVWETPKTSCTYPAP